MIPAFMLRQLYERGSLTNIVDDKGNKTGFSFFMKNGLGSGTVRGFSISVDNDEIPQDNISVEREGTVWGMRQLTTSPLRFLMGDRIKIVIEKQGGLQPGMHKILIKASTVEYGTVQFDVSDNIS